MDFYSTISPPPRMSQLLTAGKTPQTIGQTVQSRRQPLSAIKHEVVNSFGFRSPTGKAVTPTAMVKAKEIETIRAAIANLPLDTESTQTETPAIDKPATFTPVPPRTQRSPRPSELLSRGRMLRPATPLEQETASEHKEAEVQLVANETADSSAANVLPDPASSVRSANIETAEEPSPSEAQGSLGSSNMTKSPNTEVELKGNDSEGQQRRARQLSLIFRFPGPMLLPPVEVMSKHDMIRELVTVSAQREAETAAALRVLEAATQENRIASGDKTQIDHQRTTVFGQLVVETYHPEEQQIDIYDENEGDHFGRRSGGVQVDLFELTLDEHEVGDKVKVVICAPDCFELKTRCYSIPRAGIAAGAPQEGLPAAVDALTAVKLMLKTHLAPKEAYHAEGFCDLLKNSIATANVNGFINSYCRVLPHSHLTPVQSEARVRELVTVLRQNYRYEIGAPSAPLAMTRLGSSHVRDAPAELADHSQNQAKPVPSTTLSDSGSISTPSKARKESTTSETPLVLQSARKSRPAVTFNFACAVGFYSPVKLHHPIGQHALARYCSSFDLTRPGRSPASFDRDDHSAVLAQLQIGLEAMNAQRRSEEEHMRQVTRVKPSKNPKGGYLYMDIDTAYNVAPAEYEHLYMGEIRFGTEYLNSATMLAWQQDAEVQDIEMDQWTEDQREYAVFKAQRSKEECISWWDQSVDDGHDNNEMMGVALTGSACYYDSPTQELADKQRGAVWAESKTLGCVLLDLVLAWASAPPRLQGNPATSESPANTTEIVPFEVLLPIITAGAECLRSATCAVLGAGVSPRVNPQEMEEAKLKLWGAVARALEEFVHDMGAEVVCAPHTMQDADALMALAGSHEESVEAAASTFALSKEDLITSTETVSSVDTDYSLSEILMDVVEAMDKSQEGGNACDAPFTGIMMEMLPSIAEEVPSDVVCNLATDVSLSPILTAEASPEDLDSIDQLELTEAIQPTEQASRLALTVHLDPESIIPLPREESSPTPTDDDVHSSTVPAISVDGISIGDLHSFQPDGADPFVGVSAPVHDISTSHPRTDAQDMFSLMEHLKASVFDSAGGVNISAVPIPARIGIFSPQKTEAAHRRLSSGLNLARATPPPPPPRLSFVARAKAALTSVFGSKDTPAETDLNVPVDTGVDDLAAFFSPAGQACSEEK